MVGKNKILRIIFLNFFNDNNFVNFNMINLIYVTIQLHFTSPYMTSFLIGEYM
jgi:hypothetical protein